MDLTLKLDATRKLFSEKKFHISWSKVNQFNKCNASWFVQNYASFSEKKAVYSDNVKGLPGTITQKIFEHFINDRIYCHTSMRSIDELVEWMTSNSRALFNLIVFNPEDQYEIPKINSRRFFQTKEGKKRVKIAHEEHSLSPTIKSGIQPQFIDKDEFYSDHGGSLDSFILKLKDIYERNLENFKAHGLDLGLMLSEQYIPSKYHEIHINGGVDFLYNTNQKIKKKFTDLKDLENGFTIIDGKWRISKYVEKEQLFFYAALIHFKYKKTPGYLSFLDWNEAKFVIYEYDSSYLSRFRNNIARISNEAKRIEVVLSDLSEGATIYDIPDLKFTPSQSACRFCPIRTAPCKYADPTVNLIDLRKQKRDIIKDVNQRSSTGPIGEVNLF